MEMIMRKRIQPDYMCHERNEEEDEEEKYNFRMCTEFI
jgi:hypothetical protein